MPGASQEMVQLLPELLLVEVGLFADLDEAI